MPTTDKGARRHGRGHREEGTVTRDPERGTPAREGKSDLRGKRLAALAVQLYRVCPILSNGLPPSVHVCFL